MTKKYEELDTSEAARLFYSWSHAAVGGVGRLIFGFRVEGASNIPETGPAIVASNHLLDPDVLFVPTAIPNRHVTVIGREGIMNRPVQGKLFRWWGAQAIHRLATGETNREAAERGMNTMRRPLEEGKLELIFSSPPHRTPGQKPAKPIGSIARLARETGAPVVPTVIKGSDRLKQREIVVKFGEQLYHEGIKKEDKEFTRHLHDIQTDLFDSIEYPFEYLPPDEKVILKPDV